MRRRLHWLASVTGIAKKTEKLEAFLTKQGPLVINSHHSTGYFLAVQRKDGVVMMGHPGPDYKNPKRLGGVTQMVYVYVDDVDKHFAVAKAAGAHILSEPADQFYGDRTYGAEDPEGHQWSFAQHVRDVAPEDMHP